MGVRVRFSVTDARSRWNRSRRFAIDVGNDEEGNFLRIGLQRDVPHEAFASGCPGPCPGTASDETRQESHSQQKTNSVACEALALVCWYRARSPDERSGEGGNVLAHRYGQRRIPGNRSSQRRPSLATVATMVTSPVPSRVCQAGCPYPVEECGDGAGVRRRTWSCAPSSGLRTPMLSAFLLVCGTSGLGTSCLGKQRARTRGACHVGASSL
jgi:hypothetical protein